MITMKPFSYASPGTPDGYQCECGASGVRLYREYQTFLNHQKLRCRACAIKAQKRQPDGSFEHSIGWLVAAVPTEDGETFWGFTSVPQSGVEWWNRLPKIQDELGKLDSLILEAQQIVARHDGVHNAHAVVPALSCWKDNLRDGIKVDWENVEFLMSELRQLDKTGFWPK